ncbi:ATP-binding protein [Deinococcus sp. KNUC1210]|uniref:AAA family ATPase n=1 Tax=Deinococcus sp. KNUC1210 TaxID=2917691 RepID=UPI001EEFF3E0|nr:ATP-binding protein [Deinococcus sp. KNUC1210]ULH15560.1 ATP-binding protein [Deinococcus sp. KNUC1210]
MPPASIYALHGFLGSGKSTLARRLEHEVPALRLSSDDWMVQLFGPDPPEEVFRSGLARVSALIRLQAERVLSLGVSVVLDEGYWTRASRDELRSWAASLNGGLGVPLFLYAVTVPEAEARARIERRNHEPGALFVSQATFSAFLPTFEALQPDEPRPVSSRADLS